MAKKKSWFDRLKKFLSAETQSKQEKVVRLTGGPLSYHQPHDNAAVKIQAYFRGYLARRALRALRGLVKLQALIRGQAVRRQTNITLKGLQSLMKIQSMARANRMRAVVNRLSDGIKDVFHLTETEEKESEHARTECSDRKWDGSILSKEEVVALLRRRQEAALRRERAADYASTHQRRIGRRSTAPVDLQLDANTLEPKWNWLDHWVDSQHIDKDIHEVFPTSAHAQDARNLQANNLESLSFLDLEYDGKAKELDLRYPARRSFNRSGRDQTKIDDNLSKSPNCPSYMVTTASIKAKFRSMSTPKLRRGPSDFSDPSNINTDKLFSPQSSSKAPLNYQSSALLRGQAWSSKHSRSSNYHSIDSKGSLLSWDAPSPVSCFPPHK
ncbi:hypothetical protein HPP92_014177 [Vanilla planifolia]|uniref:DUF4005 domain-containing protein n=1 Tax=Vanilla planifolia TaxID=51239 RepID=A0A835QPS8_VANPL|nr:hypothetical protein HPP92_014177 [Vanilla planifolia]